MLPTYFVLTTLPILLGGWFVASTSSSDAESARERMEGRAEGHLRALEGQCFTLIAGRWSYEWCHRRHVQQFQIDPTLGEVDPVWFFGQYSHTEINIATTGPSIGDGDRDVSPSVTSVVDVFDAEDQHCDEIGKAHQTRVEFKCCNAANFLAEVSGASTPSAAVETAAAGLDPNDDSRAAQRKQKRAVTTGARVQASPTYMAATLVSVHETEVCTNAAIVCTPLVCGGGNAKNEVVGVGGGNENDRVARVELASSDGDGDWGDEYDPKVLARMTKAAKTGDSNAQTKLAVAYRTGLEVRQDETKARIWFMKAAKQGNHYSMWEIGEMYCNGGVVNQDKEKGVEWIRKAAASLGYEEVVSCGLEFLKVMNYLETHGYLSRYIDGDWNDAYEPGGFKVSQLKREAKLGQPFSQYELALCYRDGLGISQDEAKARLWFLEAAKQADPYSMWEIGNLMCNGKGVSQDKELGIEWIRKAAIEFGFEEPVSCDLLPRRQNASAQALVAECYRGGLGVRQDEVKARLWYLEAAKQGNPYSMWEIGDLLCNGGGFSQGGVAWKRKAANVLGYNGPVSCDLEYDEITDYLEYEDDLETADNEEPVGYAESRSKRKPLRDLESVSSENYRLKYILFVFFLVFAGSVVYLVMQKKKNDESIRRADDALNALLNESPPTEPSAARNRKKPKKSKRGAAAAAAAAVVASVRTESEIQPNSREGYFGESGKPKKLGCDSCKKVDPLHRIKECAFCLSPIPGSAFRCKGCSKVCYCDPSCQKSHWNEGHKTVCLQVQADYARDLDNAAIPSDRFDAAEEFLCPISKDIMDDPVVAADNQTYDRASIEQWMAQATAVLSEASACLDRGCDDEVVRRKYETQLMIGVKSPINGVAFCHMDLEPNLKLLGRICEYRSHFGIN